MAGLWPAEHSGASVAEDSGTTQPHYSVPGRDIEA